MAIFNSYVKLPEGNKGISMSRPCKKVMLDLSMLHLRDKQLSNWAVKDQRSVSGWRKFGRWIYDGFMMDYDGFDTRITICEGGPKNIIMMCEEYDHQLWKTQFDYQLICVDFEVSATLSVGFSVF